MDIELELEIYSLNEEQREAYENGEPIEFDIASPTLMMTFYTIDNVFQMDGFCGITQSGINYFTPQRYSEVKALVRKQREKLISVFPRN